MPRFYPSILISDAYGSVGEVTFYHRNGKCYYRKRSHSRYPGTAAQTSALDAHRRALAAWREVPHQTQLVWKHLAEGDCSSGVVSIVIPGYAERWGYELDKYKVYARFVLIDTVTGY